MPEHFEKKFAFKITWTPYAKTHTNACCVFFALEFFEMLVNCWKVVGYQLNIHLILFWKCWCLKRFLHWPVKVFIQKTTRNLRATSFIISVKLHLPLFSLSLFFMLKNNVNQRLTASVSDNEYLSRSFFCMLLLKKCRALHNLKKD